MYQHMVSRKGEGGGGRGTWIGQHCDDHQQRTHPLMPRPTHRSGLGTRAQCDQKLHSQLLEDGAVMKASKYAPFQDGRVHDDMCAGSLSVWGLPGPGWVGCRDAQRSGVLGFNLIGIPQIAS